MDDNDENSFLVRDHNLEQKIGSIFHPSISINNLTFRGDYNDPNVLFKALCSTVRNKPSKCGAVNFIEKRSQDLEEQKNHILDKQNPSDMAYAR